MLVATFGLPSWCVSGSLILVDLYFCCLPLLLMFLVVTDSFFKACKNWWLQTSNRYWVIALNDNF